MDYRKILSFAAVIFSTGYFVRSFQPANAFPQGSNVGTGSNPVVNFYESGSNSSTITLDQTQDFIITTIVSTSSSCFPNVNGTDWIPIGTIAVSR